VTLQQTEPWECGYFHFLQRFADFGAAIMVPMDLENKEYFLIWGFAVHFWAWLLSLLTL